MEIDFSLCLWVCVPSGHFIFYWKRIKEKWETFFFFFSFHLRNGKTRKMHCVCICGLPWNAPFVWLVNPPLLLYCNTVHASSQFIFNVRGTAGVPSLFTRILCLQHKIKKKKNCRKYMDLCVQVYWRWMFFILFFTI